MSDHPTDRRTVTYAPKRDRWITMVLWTCALVVAAGALAAAGDEGVRPAQKGVIAAIQGAVIVACVAPIYTLSYVLSDRALRVACGPIGMNIALEDIEAVTPGVKTGMTYGFSLALKGVVVERHGKRWKVFVSPLNQGDFLRDLAGRSPHLQLRDGALTRLG